MTIKSLFTKKKSTMSAQRRPAERITDLCIVTKEFSLINGEAEFTYGPDFKEVTR